MLLMLFLLIALCFPTSIEAWADNTQRRFPESFMFGVGSSAFQVEGAWNIDGKGESIWDRFLHNHPQLIPDNSNGDVAADSYHLYKRDVEMLRELGVDHYRFSVSWTRVLPQGLPNVKNEKGFQYYDKLIDELIKYHIEPIVTLYHYDLPQRLQDLGGWVNPLSIAWFEDYADEVFKRYAGKVKYWVTINQPSFICGAGYGSALVAPGLELRGIADYICLKNILLAHAKAYRLYQRNYKSMYQGKVGIALSLDWLDPVNNKTETVQATEKYREFEIAMCMDPIWSSTGDFPKVVKEIIARKSKEQGFPKSRLPTLNADEKALLRGSSDFLGMNHYTTYLVKKRTQSVPSPSYADDSEVELTHKAEWLSSQSSWLKNAPYGLYKLLIYINQKYDYPPILITEHGWSTSRGLWDHTRVTNMRGYMNALLLAMEDGAQVMGYTAWSLCDNVEWYRGVSDRFGLYEVDFDSTNKTRNARMSALVYKRLIKKRVVEEGWKPASLKIDISNRRTNKVRRKTEL